MLLLLYIYIYIYILSLLLLFNVFPQLYKMSLKLYWYGVALQNLHWYEVVQILPHQAPTSKGKQPLLHVSLTFNNPDFAECHPKSEGVVHSRRTSRGELLLLLVVIIIVIIIKYHYYFLLV